MSLLCSLTAWTCDQFLCAFSTIHQGTLDGLVGDGGLTVAVFEEVAEPDKKKGIKSRFLAQV